MKAAHGPFNSKKLAPLVINNSIKTVKRMGYGFRNFVNFKQRVLISFA